MKLMTQNACVLSEHKQTALLAEELTSQKVTLLALKDGPQSSAERLAQSLEEQGSRCSWIWFPDHAEKNHHEKGTAFLCMDRNIRCVDRFSLSKSSDSGRLNGYTALGVQIEGMEDWFYCLSQIPAKDFADRWKLLNGCIAGKRLCCTVWLLGMQSCREEIHVGSWMEAADGKIWCSCNREIRSCESDAYEKSSLYTEGAAIIEVKE